jgi:hypothetical protein
MIKPIFGAIADRFTLFGYKFGSPKKERMKGDVKKHYNNG